jgi:hypothetical protein
MRINPFIYGALVLAVFLGTIGGFQAAGVWSTSGKVTADGQAVQPSADDVDSIKGWMTLEQITSTYRIPLAGLLAQFDLPADTPASTALKDLESDVFSVTVLRDWLLSRTAPESRTESMVSLTPTVQLEQSEAGLTATAVPESTILPTTHPVSEATVTGKTTFQNLLDWGASKEEIENLIGGTIPAPDMLIKDYVTSQGLDFATVKAALQAIVTQ